MTEFKQAIDAFVESDTYKGLSDPCTLKSPEDQRQFLENRLHRAFSIGWRAAQPEQTDG